MLGAKYESSSQPHEMKTEMSMTVDSCTWQRWYLLPWTAKFLCISEGKKDKNFWEANVVTGNASVGKHVGQEKWLSFFTLEIKHKQPPLGQVWECPLKILISTVVSFLINLSIFLEGIIHYFGSITYGNFP